MSRLRLLVFLLVSLLWLQEAPAQPAGRTLGVGGQVGAPAGVTFKLYRPGTSPLPGYRPDALSVLASWDLGDAFHLHAHLVRERPIPDSPLNYYLGPGAVLGIEGDGLGLGVGGLFGVNFFRERFEVFLELAPRLNLLPATRGHLDAGVGLRYYL
ncbi:MAG: hypothetical protein D6746_15290 [Bacteroidetes bacterium]|nr:MAG: hypothetical protein D6746_15290 [Bacteroidota bacterium]GIV57225.1 MAG: RNA polymerase subunit sigma-54 [Rhodothermaceae bacterium]